MVAGAPNGRIQPVYGIDGRARLWTNERSIRFPDTGAWGRCGSVTRPMHRFSMTCTGRRSWPWPTSFSTVVWYAGETRRSSGDWNPWEKRPSPSLISQTPSWKGPAEYGKFWDEEFKNYKEILDDLGYTKKK